MKLVVAERCVDDPELAERAHHDLLRSAFTPDELPPFESFMPMFGEESLVALVDDGVIMAAAVSDHLLASPVGLLSYLAVRPE